MDSDVPEEDEEKTKLLWDDISVFDWDAPNAFEEQVFFDVPTDIATKIINIAVREYGIDSVKTRLATENIPFEVDDDEIRLSAMKSEDQKKIGRIAKKKKVEWYKRIDLGELLGNVVFENWGQIGAETKIKSVVEEVAKWVIDNE